MADGSVKIDITADDSDVKKKLDGVGDEAKDAAGGLDDLEDSAKDAGKGLDAVDVAAGNLVADGLSALIGALGNAVGDLMALADETREFREDMAKLETAFSTAGHTSDTASKAYKDFYAILGESDRSVEAVNHLAELTKNEQEVAKWSTIAAGVTAKFGDSLPIEGLTEAANHTAKLGEVQGPLADALEWIGISTEDFNLKLAECNTEEERATLITETLNSKYAAAAEEYNKLTASTQDARLATAEMEETQAELGAAIEPVTTAWTRLKTEALQAIIPVVQMVADGLLKLSQWMEENPAKAEIIKAALLGVVTALTALAVALGISSLIKTVTTAFKALNVTMLANPIALVVAALAGLVAAFIYLWNNCDGFREFWINLWKICKEKASAVVDWFKDAWPKAVEKVKGAVGTLTSFFSDIKGKILGVFSNIKDDFFKIGDNIIDGIWGGLKAGWDWLKGKVKSLASSLFGAAKDELDINSPSKKFAWVGKMSAKGQGVGYEDEMDNVEKDMKSRLAAMTARVQATVGAENARVGRSIGVPDTGFSDLARAVGTQTAGINSLASEYRRGSGNTRPVILMLDKRELGRAVVDVGGLEETRVGLAVGGAY